MTRGVIWHQKQTTEFSAREAAIRQPKPWRGSSDSLQAKGVTIFAIVDHSGEAEKVGLKMLPTKLVIFGNPQAGTPLMLAAPSSAIDLPLKILISEDREGTVWISSNSPAYLQERHGFPGELLQNIAVVQTLVAAIAE